MSAQVIVLIFLQAVEVTKGVRAVRRQMAVAAIKRHPCRWNFFLMPVCCIVRQVADAEAGAAERRQEAANQEPPLEAERTLGNEDASGDAAADVPVDAFAAVREALGPPPKQKGTKKPGAQAVHFCTSLLA